MDVNRSPYASGLLTSKQSVPPATKTAPQRFTKASWTACEGRPESTKHDDTASNEPAAEFQNTEKEKTWGGM